MRQYLYNLATDKGKGLIRAILRLFLFVLSLIYGLIIRILIFFCHKFCRRLNVKVISVGNITLGGTGKTALVEVIARYLKENGHRVAILSRGYKRKAKRYPLSAIRYEEMGDEPYMLSKKLNDIAVIVDGDRIRGAKKAKDDYAVDTVILDDGFQQWRIIKDLEILTLNASNPFGNRHMIPRGILRQPLSSLKRVDLFVLTKSDLNSDIQSIKDYLSAVNPNALIFESVYKPLGLYKLGQFNKTMPLDILKDKTVNLFSGIADPDSFEKLTYNLGIKVDLHFRFPDHYNYSQRDIENIINKSRQKNIDTLVTTEKDAVKLERLTVTTYQISIFVLSIELKIKKDEEKFCNRLLGIYSV